MNSEHTQHIYQVPSFLGRSAQAALIQDIIDSSQERDVIVFSPVTYKLEKTLEFLPNRIFTGSTIEIKETRLWKRLLNVLQRKPNLTTKQTTFMQKHEAALRYLVNVSGSCFLINNFTFHGHRGILASLHIDTNEMKTIQSNTHYVGDNPNKATLIKSREMLGGWS